MPTKSASKIITRDARWFGPAIPPGEMLLEEFLKPMGIGQVDAARRLGISLNRLNEIVLGNSGCIACGEDGSRRSDGLDRLAAASAVRVGREAA